MAQLVGASGGTPKVCKFDPLSGYVEEATDLCVSLSLAFSLPLPLESMNISSDED